MAENATQNFVPVQEVRDGVAVLKDGSLRRILMVSSMNFALKSADEQQSILLQFQDFLNTLEFPLQISVQSRKLDIEPYLALLEEQYEKQSSDLMRVQTREYIEFVKSFVESENIMSKHFFVVVPYQPALIGQTGSWMPAFAQKLFGGGDSGSKDRSFEESRSQLEQRVASVQQGISRMGLRAARLGTEETIELFYTIFNPGEKEKPMSQRARQQAQNAQQ